jgi:hypothetical protein
VRVLVNKLLDWHGAPIILGRGKTHVVTYADILRDLEKIAIRRPNQQPTASRPDNSRGT